MRLGVAGVAVLLALLGAAPASALDLETTSATELSARMTAGELTSRELTQAYLERIEAVNQRGPSLNAVRSLNPDALREARESDAIRRRSGPRGPLEGLPVLLKDNIDVAGMASTAGSIALEHSVPDRDATIVRRLRAAGAVILGKVNLTEFAAFVSNEQQSGNSSLGGQVLNPYDLSADPGGSSSGSGVAAAAGLAALTIGSDSEGSIISPATSNGVVGIRPTTGLWSRHGIVPISFTQDTAGPLTQTVSDSALLLTALTAVDPADPATEGTAAVEGTDYTEALDADALRGARIGINVASLSNAQYAAARAALDRLGAVTVEITLPNFPPAPQYGILAREFRRDLTNYLSQLPPSAPIKTFDQAYAFLKAHPEEGMKYGDTRMQPSSTFHLEDPEQLREYEMVRDSEVARAREYLTGILERDDLDAVLNLQLGLISPAAYGGFPIVSVPAGFVPTTGRPVNVTFLGRRYSEEQLVGFAYALEQGTRLRRGPSEVNPASWRCVPRCVPVRPLEEALRPPKFDLENLSVREIRERGLGGERLVRAYLDRIRFVNRQGPGINAVRAIDPHARGGRRGPLAGIPLLVSDTIDVAGMPTTAGSLALERLVPRHDAAVVGRLRDAGAIVLGKTNVTELSGLVSPTMPAGYGSLSGQVLNPYDMRLSPNGSSAGAAAAVAAGLATAAVGVESDATTQGTNTISNSSSPSVVVSAAATGVVGMRPTLGLVDTEGVLPVARSQDTPGPLARTVADAAAVLAGMVGPHPERIAASATGKDDDSSAGTRPKTFAASPDEDSSAGSRSDDFTAALDEDALAGKRIGVVPPGPNDTAARDRFAEAVEVITRLGATPVTLTPPARPSVPKIVDREFKRDFEAYLGRHGSRAPVRSLADVIAFNEEHGAKFGQERLQAAAAVDLSDPQTAAQYQSDLESGRAASRAWIDGLLEGVDAILSPTANTAEVGARAGYPQVTVPAGYDPIRRRPVNVSFTGTAGDDAKLLGFAYAYERAARVRRTPSQVNPATWHCVAPIAYEPRTCPP